MAGPIASSALTHSLASELATRGIALEYAGFPGTGPLTNQGELWRADLAAKLDDFDPDLVLIQASGCYALFGLPEFVDSEGNPAAHGSAAFFTAWSRQVTGLVEQVHAHGTHAAILTVPAAADHAHTHRYWAEHNSSYQEIAEATGATLLDWNEWLSPAGHFQTAISVLESEIPVRDPDGIHLTPEGQRLAAAWLTGRIGGSSMVLTRAEHGR